MKRFLWGTLAVLAVAGIVWAVGQYGEDEAHVSGVFGNLILGVRKDTPTALAGTDGDYAVPETSAYGELWTATAGVPFEGTTGGVLVGSTTTTVATVTLGGRAQHLVFEVAVAGTLGLNGFKVQCRDHASGSWYDYLDGTDFDSTTNSNMLFATSTGPHEVGTTADAHVHIRISGVDAVAFGAVTAVGTVTVTVRGTASR